MKIEHFLTVVGADFFVGVPDSQLKPLCDYLICAYGIDPKHHLIAANEGNCIALATGYHLATGKVPVVYMQNSGIGNAVNPLASLVNDGVYAVPLILIVGWRGEPGTPDEPQHIYQGAVTLKLLEDMGIRSFIVDKETSCASLELSMKTFKEDLSAGKTVAFVIRKDALSYEENIVYKNTYTVKREEIIQHIVKVSGDDPIVSTTGKISRELFETRASYGEGHESDFLTVGSMGHASSIALGIALNKPNCKIWCIDGDGAALMHMGAMALIGATGPSNLIHVIVNNEAHESVGGMPTVAGMVNFVQIARACGYPYAVSVNGFETLDLELKAAKKRNALSLIEVKCAIGARNNLGRPTSSTFKNKTDFMEYLKSR